MQDYIGNEYDDGGELVKCIKNNLMETTFDLPADLPAEASAAARMVWEKKCGLIATAEDKMRKNVS